MVATTVSQRRCARFLDFDRQAGWVQVEAGITLQYLNARLAAWGMALQAPGDFDRMTVATALATGAHGSGRAAPSLAAQVLDLDLVGADGHLLHCSAEVEPEVFAAARCCLGALGVVARVTLRAVPAFNVVSAELVVPLGEVDLAAEVAGSEFFSCAWHPHTRRVTLRRREPTTAPPGGLGYTAWFARHAARNLAGVAVGAATAERVRGLRRAVPPAARVMVHTSPRHYSDRSYRVLVAPRWVGFVESEWALPRAQLANALEELVSWHEQSWARHQGPVVAFPVEVSTGAADDIWCSAAYGRDTAYVAARGVAGDETSSFFSALAAIMGPLGGRPRLGSVITGAAPDLAPRYPKWAQWHELRRRLDPQGRLASPESDRVLGPVR